jgi:hypothetical protein
MRDPREQMAAYGEAHLEVTPAEPELTEVPSSPVGRYTPPVPPPRDMPVSLDKWRALDRKTRRALLREHRKVTGS